MSRKPLNPRAFYHALGTNIRPEIVWDVLRQAVLFAEEPVKGHRDTHTT
jgi:hypothetical protein